MASQIPSSWKYCATCAYWLGNREPERYGTYVMVDSQCTYGRCCKDGNGWTGRDRQASATCNQYQKWPVLK